MALHRSPNQNSATHQKLTFLIHTSEDHDSKADKKEQTLRRHQHAAMVAHQRIRTQRNRSLALPKPRPNSSTSPSTSTSTSTCICDGRKVMSRSSSEGDQSLSTSPSPRSDPSGGLFDPFDVLNVSSNGARSSMSTVGQSQMMFRTAIIEQWPSFALSSRAQDIETWRTATVTLALQHAYLASAIIYAGSSYQYFFGARDPASNFVRMTAYNDTLRQVRKAIEALVDDGCTGATPDARAKADTVVLAVALLAIHGPPVDMQGSTLVGPQQMKDYEYYGSRTWEPTHLHALLCLTKQRGGLQHVGMQSLAGMILTIDLVDSLLTLRQPTFPLFFPPGPLLQSLRTIAPLPGTVCQGFRFLRNRRHGQRFVSITQDVHALLNAYSMVLQDPAVGIDFGQLVATWRLLQHQALTVATGGDLLFNLCRAAVVVFLAECLEPLPVVGAFHRNSSRSLMLLIDECDKRDCWLSCPDLLLWASILGGYVSRGSALRPWYIQQLRSSPVAVQKERWGEVLRLGDGFLPFRHRQADGCFGFWREACEWLTPSSFLDS